VIFTLSRTPTLFFGPIAETLVKLDAQIKSTAFECGLLYMYFFQLWSSKWSIKDEHKLLSELGSSAANGGSPYYDAQTGFPTVTTTADLYESISTMTQAQSTPVYTPPIGTSLGR